MNSADQNFSFTLANDRMGFIREETFGRFNEVFGNRTFKGQLERIVLDFDIREYKPRERMAFVSSKIPQSFLYMPIIYRAYGGPKKFWRFKLDNVIASVSLTMVPKLFGKSQMVAEEYIDFVVADAQVLSRRYGLRVEIVYHGDQFYARKYLPNLPKP